MNRDEAVAQIDTVPRPNTPDTVARMARALAACGHPERSLRSVLVAGTNGKGSTAAMLAGMARAAGHRVGLASKPHLARFNERCQVDGSPISDLQLVRRVEQVLQVESRLEPELGRLTNPERRYLAWFLHFAEERPDLVVCEVNEGGRWDATNVLDAELAVVTSVGMDHQDTLGDRLAQIAWHKAGVVKTARPVVTGAQGEALAVIEAEARSRQAPLLRLGQEVRVLEAAADARGCAATVLVRGRCHDGLWTPMLGRFQLQNLALAVAAADTLCDRGFRIGPAAIRSGLAATRISGRLEIISHDPITIVDGAHNEDKVRALTAALEELFPGRPVVSVVSTTEARVDAVVPHLARCSQTLVACCSRFARAADPTRIADAARSHAPQVMLAGTVPEAVEVARDEARRSGGLVVVTGMLIVLGEVPAANPASTA